MRFVVSMLACVGVGGMSLALADPPANSTPATAAPAASAPASPAAKAPASTVNVDAQKPDQLEAHFLAEGYKLEMHNGEKYFCRREETLGTRLGAQKVCGTAQQLQATEREAHAAYQRGQSQQRNPSGN